MEKHDKERRNSVYTKVTHLADFKFLI